MYVIVQLLSYDMHLTIKGNHLMNTPNENSETSTRTRRPGFWLRAIEHRKHEMTREYRRGLGDAAREGISDEDYATTMATLEKMATNLGWDESQRPEFGPGFGPFGPGKGRGFGGRGHRHPGHDRGFAPRDRREETLPNDGPEA